MMLLDSIGVLLTPFCHRPREVALSSKGCGEDWRHETDTFTLAGVAQQAKPRCLLYKLHRERCRQKGDSAVGFAAIWGAEYNRGQLATLTIKL